jgi:hypothetical protein
MNDLSGAAYLRKRYTGDVHAIRHALPLFTSVENASDYAKRSNDMKVHILELSTADDIISFVERPPHLPGMTPPRDFDVILDPIAPNIGEFMGFVRDTFIAALKGEKPCDT